MLASLAMADYASFSDDISTLWGPAGDSGLTPASPAPLPVEEMRPADPPAETATSNGLGYGNGNGAGVAFLEQDLHDDVLRLAEALATNHADVLRPTDLDAVRSQMEGAFTHQIAVALYELMAASNARFATAEDQINQRVIEAVEVHTNRLTASLEKHHRAGTELSEFIRAELNAIRQRLDAPIDGLAEFQREVRHQVGRLGDLAAEAASARRSEAESEASAGAAAGELSEVASALAALRNDVAALRLEVAELRANGGGRRRKTRGSGRWARTG
jgi:hypothetical protein